MKFSVTIPAFKSKYLYDTIESILNQTYSDFELIIVNDCSPENLKSIVDEFCDKRIRYYRNTKNCGAIDVVDNWNICLSYCTGDYVICMGDDDRLLPNCLAEYKNLIEKYPDLDVYHAWTEIIDESSTVYTIQEARPEFESAYSLIWHRWNSRKYQFIGDFLFRICSLRKKGGYYKIPLAWGSDDITAVRAALSHGIANTQVPCFQYRFNRLSITKSGNCLIKANSVLLEKQWYYKMLEKTPINPLDEFYCNLIRQQLNSWYQQKIKVLMHSDLRSNKTNVLKWMKHRKEYQVSFTQVVKEFIVSLFM